MLGAELWTYKLLEWEIAHLTNVLEPGSISRSHDAPGAAFAADFAAAVGKVGPRFGAEVAAGLQTLASTFNEHVERHTALLYARPCSIDGQDTLSYGGAHRRANEQFIHWTESIIAQTAKDFEQTASEINNFRWRSRFSEELAVIGDLGALNLDALGGADVRAAAATAKVAIEKSLIPLVALSHVATPYGALPFIEALGKAGIFGAGETEAMLNLAREVERASLGDETTTLSNRGPAIEELWRLARSPGIVRHAVMYRARAAHKVPAELPRPLPEARYPSVPIVTVENVTISVATAEQTAWNNAEIIIDVDHRHKLPTTGAMVMTYGSRVIGTQEAIILAPWLVDEPFSPVRDVA